MSASPSSSNSDKTFTIDPYDNLSITTYKIRITTGVKDNVGHTLSSQYEQTNGFVTCSDNVAFAIGGRNGLIFTSPNGTTCWVSRISGTTEHLDGGVWYLNNLFIALGNNGTILTSSDGVTWISRTSGTANRLWAATYGSSKFVVVGDSGTVLTSPNGTTWTSRSSGASFQLMDVIFVSTFVTVGGYVGNLIYTSPDGVNWTSRSVQNGQLKAIAYGNGFFVAGGGGTGDTLWISSDGGSNWSSKSIDTDGSTVQALTFVNGFFLGVVAEKKVITSFDNGTTWSTSSANTLNQSFMDVVYGNGIFLGIGHSGLGTSSDNGTTWNSLSSEKSIDGITIEGLKGAYKE